MRIGKIVAATAALSLMSAPALAQSDSSSSAVSVDDEGLGQLSWVVIFGVIALAIGIAVSGGNDNKPVSP